MAVRLNPSEKVVPMIPAGPTLFGREHELESIAGLLRLDNSRGGALVIVGDAGVGKSALLNDARRNATAAGVQVLSTVGAESEAHLGFAGLHQLLQPVLDGMDDLPEPQRQALRSVFGLSDRVVPDLFLIALATLTLLTDRADVRPLLLIVEDAQWLDASTADLLAFVGRRLESDAIAMLVALRPGFDTSLTSQGLQQLELGVLGERAARALLDAQARPLSPGVRDRVLEEAAGNPLGLLELPRALDEAQAIGATELPDELPLTARLERVFAARAVDLDSVTQTILLAAAVNDGDLVAEALQAAARISDRALTLSQLSPAIYAGLVSTAGDRIRFRHPLVRSAIRQSAIASERQAAHAALAAVVPTDSERRAWHRAGAAIGPDEGIAAELEVAGDRAQRRGALTAAVVALERAASFTQAEEHKAARLLRAAELAMELGRVDTVARIVRATESLQLASRDVGRLAWLRQMATPDVHTSAAAADALLGVAGRMAQAGDIDLAVDLVFLASVKAHWADRESATGAQLVAATDELPVAEGDPRRLAILARAAPIERSQEVIDRAIAWTPDPADPHSMYYLGHALGPLGAHVLAEPYLTAASRTMREQGRLRLLTQILLTRAYSWFLLGRWSLAAADAEEVVRLAEDTDQPIWKSAARCVQAMLTGVRGDGDDADALVADAERIGLPLRTPSVLVFVQMARGLTALSRGRSEDAFHALRRICDPNDPSHHRFYFALAVNNLAEAAVASGHRNEARTIVAEMVEPITASASPWLQVSVRHARAVLADDDEAEALFRTGLDADLGSYPFDRARLQMAYGIWLRRRRRAVDSRPHLRTARDTFDALGADPWAERARHELRASGERSGRRRLGLLDELSPQEFRIAEMAAVGLSNREIGERLFLSHRTIASHLYRIFPKLGVASRHDLREIMGASTGPGGGSGDLESSPRDG